MKHAFRFSREYGLELSRKAPRLGRARGAIVGENDMIVLNGGFDLEGAKVEVLPPPPTERIVPPYDPAAHDAEPQFETTVVTVGLLDTLSAALLLEDKATAALNFANAYNPGGGYRRGAQAQEEDLCRLLPQLIHSLEAVRYPIREDEGECLVTRDLMAVREVGSYKPCQCQGLVNMLTSAMPCGCPSPGTKEWHATVTLRIRGVLHAARVSGFTKLVLGAWGCGAFGNPPDLVSKLFRDQLSSPEFRGAFSHVVFAIVDPRGDGNYQPFLDEVAQMDEPERDRPAASRGGEKTVERE